MEIISKSKSLQKEFLRAVCYYISDAATFKSFALVARQCALLAKEYEPMKMDEFSRNEQYVSGCGTGLTVCKILPCGLRHGWCRIYTNNKLQIILGDTEGMFVVDEILYQRGVLVSRVWMDFAGEYQKEPRYFLTTYKQTTETFRMIRRLVEFGYTEEGKSFCFRHPTRGTVTSRMCALCRRFHVMVKSTPFPWIYSDCHVVSITKWTERYIVFFSDCLGKKCNLSVWQGLHVWRYWRRMEIAQSIIAFAKSVNEKAATLT